MLEKILDKLSYEAIKKVSYWNFLLYVSYHRKFYERIRVYCQKRALKEMKRK